ncbi:MAG: NUDIX hydrolase [Cyclobacteriaceae bacterium]
MPNPWKTLSTKKIYDNPWISLNEDQIINPSGGEGIYGTVHFKNLAIGILPLDEEMNTWLVGQWRYPLNEYSWEIPMGGGQLHIDPIDSAKRELKEETGITAKKWEEIIKIHLSNCVSDEVGYGFLATDLTFGDTNFDETEDLEIRKLPFSEALQMCLDGKITDSLSVATILKADRMFNP